MKAKEKEMKDEKEEDRKVRLPHAVENYHFDTDYHSKQISVAYKPLRTRDLPRKSARDSRRWPRRCTRSGWSDLSGRRRGTS